MNCHFKLQVCVKANSIWNGLSKMFNSFIQIRVVCNSCVYVIPQEPLYYDIINYSTYMNERVHIHRMLCSKTTEFIPKACNE